MNLKLAFAAALVFGSLAVSPALAQGYHGGRHGGGHARPHGGGRPHFGPHGGGRPHFGPHGGGGWHGGRQHARGLRPVIIRPGPRIYVDRRYVDRRPVYVDRRPVYVGPRRVFVNRPSPVYARPAGYGPGCSTTRHVGPAPYGWHKVVTTRTCIVP